MLSGVSSTCQCVYREYGSLETGKDSNFLVQARLHSVGGRSQESSAECPLMKAVFGGANPLPFLMAEKLLRSLYVSPKASD